MSEGPVRELRVGEVAQILGISDSAVRNLPAEVLRPSKRLLGRGDRRYRLADVLRVRDQMQTETEGDR